MAVQRRSTDFGTVILHAVIATSFLVLVATGLRIATNDPETEWLLVLDPVLPNTDLWYNHLVAGTVLFAALVAYALYVLRARLTSRVRLDRSRLVTMRSGGRARWAAINCAVYWVMMASLVLEIATGVMLFAGAGRSVLVLHRDITWICIAAVVLHVVLHAAYGGVSQLARVFRPAPLVVAPAPPDLADLLAAELARRCEADGGGEQAPGDEQRPRTATLHAHPLSIGLVAAFVVSSLAIGAEQATRPSLRVGGITSEEAPALDGDISDPVWARTTPVSVLTTQGGDFNGTHESLVEVRAVHDGIYAYFSFVWDDPTRSLKHMPLVKRGGLWFVAASRDDLADEQRFNEDKFAILIARSGLPLIGGAIHLARRPISDKPPSSTGRGLHYTVGGGIADVWQWRASHGGPAGHVDNCHFGDPVPPAGEQGDPVYQYSGGFALDPGQPAYESNVVESRTENGRMLIRPKRLPRDLAGLVRAMGRLTDGVGESESEHARWWMLQSESVPYTQALDASIPDGTVLPGVVVPDRIDLDAGSIRGSARWAAGRWTLEVARRLYTGSRFDIPIKTGVLMWVAAFDHAEKRHTRHLRPFRLEID